MPPFIQYPTRLLLARNIHCLHKQSIYLHSTRALAAKPSYLTPVAPRRSPVKSSYSPYAVLVLVAFGGAIAYEYLSRSSGPNLIQPAAPPIIERLVYIEDPRTPAYHKMSVPEGYIGNLTPQQEAKLRDFWALTLKTFGVEDPDHPDGIPTAPPTAIPAHVLVESPEKKKKKRSMFSRSKHDDDAASISSTGTADDDDKYGQTAELQQILKTSSADSLRTTFWEMVKADHPDALLLRFLRARKWDLEKGLAMLISTMSWRSTQMHVDDDIMLRGEGGALLDSKSSDAAVKREGHDFLAQMRMGKSFLHGTDKDGRPITYVRAKLHRGGEQTEKSMERYTVYVIETARLMLRPPVETACIIFDMTGFTLQNMDYAPVKFMIKVFEANYPESLGAVLVHKAPWLFQGIWKIIKGWLDPVVAAKVHFTNTVEDMEAFVPRNQIIKELGGSEDWDYQYVEHVEGENKALEDSATRTRLQEERKKDVLEYQKKTFAWIAAGSNKEEADRIKLERDALSKKLNDNYWQLDSYVRARSLYDRVGMIEKGGRINFYAKHTLKAENVNGSTIVDSGPSKAAAAVHLDDDVD